jgi:hypothetical protein
MLRHCPSTYADVRKKNDKRKSEWPVSEPRVLHWNSSSLIVNGNHLAVTSQTN